MDSDSDDDKVDIFDIKNQNRFKMKKHDTNFITNKAERDRVKKEMRE